MATSRQDWHSSRTKTAQRTKRFVWLSALFACCFTSAVILRAGEAPSELIGEANIADSTVIAPESLPLDEGNEVRPASLLQPRPLLLPAPEAPVAMPSAPSSIATGDLLGSRRARPSLMASSPSRINAESASGREGKSKATTDAGGLLGTSSSVLGVGVQRRNPIVSDPRIRGSRVGKLASSGSYWVPARIDLDSMLSKIDSRIVQDVTVIKGPYSALYGPGYDFIDVNFLQTPRYEQAEVHGSTSADYKSNGDQWYGRQNFWGGGEDYGFRIGYGERAGSDYHSGNGTSMPSSYKSRELDMALGFDLTDDSHIEFNYLRLDQTDVELPGQAFDLNSLVTDAFEVTYELNNQDLFDRLVIETWYNNTQLGGDTSRSDKHRQFPLYTAFGLSSTTNVASLSSGFWLGGSWDHDNDSQTTAGVDLRVVRQRLDEFTSVTAPIALSGNSPIPKSTSANPGLFVEHLERPTDRWTMTMGGRVDFVDTEVNGDANQIVGLSTPQPLSTLLGTTNLDQNFTLWSLFLTNKFRATDELTLTASAGHAERAPNLTELYAAEPFMFLLQNGLSTVTGSPNLKQERLWQIDVGAEWTSGPFHAGGTLFHAWVNDFITLENIGEDPAQVNLKFVNTKLATLAGFEAYGEHQTTPWLTSFTTVNFVEGRDHSRNNRSVPFGGVGTRPSEEPLPQILPLQARIGVRLHQPTDAPRWNLELAARLMDHQDRIAKSLAEQVTPGFTIWDIRANWRATDRWTLIAGCENFTNKNFQEHLDYRPRPGNGGFATLQPGANFYLGSELTY